MALLRGALALLLFSLNSLFWCSLLLLGALFKALLPEGWRGSYIAWLHPLVDAWVACNRAIISGLGLLKMNIQAPATLRRDRWYLVLSNHQSWTDILVLQCSLLPHMPVLKFFMKRELIWVPLIGLSCWALDFPFMRRYPSEVLQKNPTLRQHDQQATKAACVRFQKVPTSILNFAEGTRFTAAKHAQQGSPFRRLLKPKTGGIAQVVYEMHTQLHSVADITLSYRGGPPDFWQFLCGQCPEVQVIIKEYELPLTLTTGNYDDPSQREAWRLWLDNLWTEKDALLERTLTSSNAP